ncbi:putative S-adenosylmethionine-dependent methyltransferase [uncultured archaeon]|nr:putative S-adenosylmethionine-dependent methyltransferase [uncultured archaeon]
MEKFDFGPVSLLLTIPSSVYLPSDDTEMLAQAAQSQVPPGSSVLEIGTGSGAVILSLAKSGKKFKQLVAVDLNPDAVETAKKNAKENEIDSKSVSFLQSDLFSSLPASSKFDFILFNPPYLPTSKLDKVKGALNSALDGGPDGLKTVRPFLAEAGKHLAPGGNILLVVSSLQPKDKLQALLARHPFSHSVLLSKSFFFEKLEIWELSQKA